MRGQRGAINLASLVLVALGMIFIGIGAFFIPIMLEGFEAGRTACSGDTHTDNFSDVAGGFGGWGNVTLTRTLCELSASKVTLISDNASGAVLADNYTSPLLFLTTLDAGSNSVNVTYTYEAVGYFTGLKSIIQVGPTILVLGFIVGGAVVGFMGIKGLGS